MCYVSHQNEDGNLPEGRESSPLPPDPPSPMKMTIEGNAKLIAEEVAAVGPEGRPGDPHAGPGRQVMMIAVAVGVFGAAIVVIGLTASWLAAVAALGFGLLATVLNPVLSAALLRAGDRRRVLEERPPEEALLTDKDDVSPRTP